MNQHPPQKEIEAILTRQLASCLAIPVFLVDNEGTLIYFNEPAERVLGQRFDEAGEMPLEKWATVFSPADDGLETLGPDELPLVIALRDGRPAHKRFSIRGIDGRKRQIEVTAFPLIGQAGRRAGAVALFWETEP